MRGKRGSAWIFVLILVVILLIVGTIMYLDYEKKKKEKIVEEELAVYVPPPQHVLNIIVRDSDKNRIDASYYLYDINRTIVREGFLVSPTIAQYPNATENQTYYLEAWDNDDIQPDFYKNQVDCVIGSGDLQTCEIFLEKEGNPKLQFLSVDSTKIKLFLYNDYGVVKYPILCFQYALTYDYFAIEGYDKQQTPDDLKLSYDFCINEYNMYAGNSKSYDIKKTGWGKIKVLVRDFCDAGYYNNTCGIEDRVFETVIRT